MTRWILALAAVAALPLAARRATVHGAEGGQVPGFVRIPGGRFEMGDHHDLGGREHRSDEVPVHTVRVSTFHMAATETTNKQYCAFLNAALAAKQIQVKRGLVYGIGGRRLFCDTHESDSASGIAWDGRTFTVRAGRASHPAVCIRWFGAAAYCNWLGAKGGYPACYDLAADTYDISRGGFRLPTEAEWEYAARGGKHRPYYVYPWGNDASNSKANWPRSGDPYEAGPYPWTTPVGFYNGKLHRKADFGWPGRRETYQTSDGSNGYGLHDMAGNVWEWVNDWYSRDYYRSSPAENPPGPARGTAVADGNTYRTLRGGNWYNGPQGHSRAANRNPSYYRGPDDPDHRWYHIGFRVVLGAPLARSSAAVGATPAAKGATPAAKTDQNAERTIGLLKNDPGAFKGYTLFAPKHYLATYLIDNAGRLVHSWTKSPYEPGQSVYLLGNGHLLRCCFTKGRGFTRGGEGGRVEEYDWDGKLVWQFNYSTDTYMTHHDIEPLPNGNILMLAVEKRTYQQCIAAGFQPQALRDRELYPDYVIEVARDGPRAGKIVWEWHVWDHLIQDEDRTKANYGSPAAHPELIDTQCNGRGAPAFWNHMNSIDYNKDLDQIMLSVRGCSELWVIDHSTTTEQAAGHSGGKAGRGGDLLYRWGNPAAYGAGGPREQMLFQQHDSQWIRSGCPGAGNILIFNNGLNRSAGRTDARGTRRRGGYSSVDEIVPPGPGGGRYPLKPGSAWGPEKLKWTYAAKNPADFYAEAISGAQRLPNGNTLVCDGTSGVFFETTPGGEIVWHYVCPVVRTGPLAQGERPGKDHRGHDWNAVFKIHRYPPDYPAFAGRDLAPGKTIELPASMLGRYRPKRPDRAPDADGRKLPGRGGRGGRRGRDEPPRRRQ